MERWMGSTRPKEPFSQNLRIHGCISGITVPPYYLLVLTFCSWPLICLGHHEVATMYSTCLSSVSMSSPISALQRGISEPNYIIQQVSNMRAGARLSFSLVSSLA